MKRISMIAVILLVISAAVFAQQAGGPPQTAETMAAAQQTLNDAKKQATDFEAVLADLKTRNTSNLNADTYARIKNEIEQLEFQINVEETRIRSRLNKGTKVNPAMFDRLQRLMDQHKAKVAELERFVAG